VGCIAKFVVCCAVSIAAPIQSFVTRIYCATVALGLCEDLSRFRSKHEHLHELCFFNFR